MIYEFPDEHAPIRQGDIFARLPRVEVSLGHLSLIGLNGPYKAEWGEVADQLTPVNAILPIRPVTAIVINQDCDLVRAQDVTLCEIRHFSDVEGMSKQTKTAKKWASILTQHARLNLKWFYLPPDSQIGFDEKMAADFTVTIRLPREDLEQFRSCRQGRLNDVADEHFRERLSEFFRRYPYNEWYSLDDEELAEYKKRHADAEPFPWQGSTSNQ
jgi:hypothetical protein